MTTGTAKALHVGVIRGGKFIDDRYFTGGGPVTVGEGERNTFVLPLSALPESLSLFQRRNGRTTLFFTDEMRGRVALAGRDVELAEARKLARRAGGRYEILLDEGSRGRVSFGDVTIVFNFGPPPPAPPRSVLPPEARGTLFNIVDHTFTAVLAVSVALHVGFVGFVSQRELPPAELTMEDIPDRFAKLLVPDKPVVEEKPKAEEQKPEETAKAEEKVEEEAKEEAPPKDSVEHKQKVQKAVADKGLVKIVGSLGNTGGSSALANVFGSGGNFTVQNIGEALAGAGGVVLATEAGAARRGDGAAQAASIGDLATTGGGRVAMREKRDVAVKGQVSAEGDAEVDSPSIDKDAVAKFIRLRLRSVQGCYEAQLKRSPTLRGKIVVRFVIGTRGQVVEVSIDQDTMGNDAVASCVRRIIKTWRLPFTPEAETPVSFPFLFQPG